MKKQAFAVIFFLLFFMAEVWAEENSLAAQRLQPSDLVYLGAFRLPDNPGGTEVQSWAWGGWALTYNANGDVGGAADGFPGSLFGAGHAWEYQVSEISIPKPVISVSKTASQLNTAGTLQNFRDVTGVSGLEMPRVGLALLSAQGAQTSPKIYFCRGYHLMEEVIFPSFGWFETTLSSPQIKGYWHINSVNAGYNSNDYMCPVPAAWAAVNAPGLLLAAGRYRDGGWSGQGPAIYAIGPWNDGNPPANGAALTHKALLRYSSSLDGEGGNTMTDYQHSDEWSGMVWISSGNKSAVLFVGTKGVGDCWYGDSNGPCLECAGQRGWWSTSFEGRFIFYDPADLAKTAAGTMAPWEPQPYASMNVDNRLYHITSNRQWYHLGAAAYDSGNRLLYVFEPYADEGDKPLIHVWRVNSGGVTPTETMVINRSRLNFAAISGGAVTPAQTLGVSNSGSGTMNWTASGNATWLSLAPASGSNGGRVSVSVNPAGLGAGVYTGLIAFRSDQAHNSPQTVAVSLSILTAATNRAPFGTFETPGQTSPVSGNVAVTGWVLDDVGIASVAVYRHPAAGEGSALIFIGNANQVEGARPDVEAAHPGYPQNWKAGWGYMMLTNFLPDSGNGTFTFSAIATDIAGKTATLGTRTVTCDNAHSVRPFGTIETPDQGGAASGSAFTNWGWVLTPPPRYIPYNGSTIQVYIDGRAVGRPTYGFYRVDIATLFPGYANKDGAFGYLRINTSGYANGIHTIQWVATDSAGNTDGIGSRYFTIQNQRGGGYEMSRADCVEGVPAQRGAPWVIRDHNPSTRRVVTDRDRNGVMRLSMSNKGSIALFLGEPVSGGETPLPVGASLDQRRGILYWHPGEVFRGQFLFRFRGLSGGVISLLVFVSPEDVEN